MSDDGRFEDAVNDAIDASDIGERPDINDYLYDYDPEWEAVFDGMPNDLSEGAIYAIIDFLWDLDVDDWDIDAMYEDFWDWFEAHYNEN